MDKALYYGDTASAAGGFLLFSLLVATPNLIALFIIIFIVAFALCFWQLG